MAIHQYSETTDYSVSPYKVEPKWTDFAHGCVIYVGTRSTQIMSDVWGTELYAVYWDHASQSVKTAHLDTYEWNRGKDKWGLASAEVDATPEVWAKVQKFYEERFFGKLKESALSEASTIIKGSEVKVTSGRNWKGTAGPVVAMIERPYRMGYRSHMETKVAIALSDEKVAVTRYGKTYHNYKDLAWVWARNCELIQARPINEKEIRNVAAAQAKEKVEGIQTKRFAP